MNDDCNQILCELPGDGELYITVMDCSDPPGISVIVKDSNGQAVFNETFTEGETTKTYDEVSFTVNIQKEGETLGIEVCFNTCSISGGRYIYKLSSINVLGEI